MWRPMSTVLKISAIFVEDNLESLTEQGTGVHLWESDLDSPQCDAEVKWASDRSIVDCRSQGVYCCDKTP